MIISILFCQAQTDVRYILVYFVCGRRFLRRFKTIAMYATPCIRALFLFIEWSLCHKIALYNQMLKLFRRWQSERKMQGTKQKRNSDHRTNKRNKHCNEYKERKKTCVRLLLLLWLRMRMRVPLILKMSIIFQIYWMNIDDFNSMAAGNNQ